jgi:SAM-dependent methyltransferase
MVTMITRHLDLGCGRTPRNPFGRDEVHAIDLMLPEGFDPARFAAVNLSVAPIPYPQGYFESVSAYDFLEHVPRVLPSADGRTTVLPFIRLMNEIWRVLAPGGRFYAITPAVPSLEAFSDPTHVNYLTRHTHDYFCGEAPLGRPYGFVGRFDLRRCERAMLPEDFAPDTRLTWIRAAKKAIRGARGRLTHIVWDLVAVKAGSSASPAQ